MLIKKSLVLRLSIAILVVLTILSISDNKYKKK